MLAELPSAINGLHVQMHSDVILNSGLGLQNKPVMLCPRPRHCSTVALHVLRHIANHVKVRHVHGWALEVIYAYAAP